MPSVLQDWVTELPLMMQGTLMTGIRGNDLSHAPKIKPVVRWIRAQLLIQGNPENDFMEVKKLPAVEEFEDELEYMTVHYYRHLLHTLEIIGYKHPEMEVSEIAMDYYLRLVSWCHLAPESHEELNERLSGKEGTTGTSRVWEGIVPSKKKSPKKSATIVCAGCGYTTRADRGGCVHCGNPTVVAAPVNPPVHSHHGGNSY